MPSHRQLNHKRLSSVHTGMFYAVYNIVSLYIKSSFAYLKRKNLLHKTDQCECSFTLQFSRDNRGTELNISIIKTRDPKFHYRWECNCLIYQITVWNRFNLKVDQKSTASTGGAATTFELLFHTFLLVREQYCNLQV